MKKIPYQRLLFYLVVCGFIPIIFSGANLYYKKKAVDSQEAIVNLLYQEINLEKEKQEFNEMVYNHYKKADRLYIENELETLGFLKNEQEKLTKLLQIEVFKDNELFQKRLNFLSGRENKLVFVEGKVESYLYYKETLLSLRHPIEADETDIKQILVRIENLQLEDEADDSLCPQFIITDFKLERKRQEGQEESFKLDLKLLKRDYFSTDFQ